MIGVVVKDRVAPWSQRVSTSLTGVLDAQVLEAAQELAGAIRKEIYSTFSGRTGGLARSYREAFVGTKGAVHTAGVFSDSVYAEVQEEGGIIRPRHGKNLAVPFPGAPTRGKWPRDFAPGQLVFIPRGGRAPLLALVSSRKVGGGREGPAMPTKITPMFILKPSVRLTGKHYVQRAAESSLPKLLEIIGGGADLAIQKAVK